MVGQEPSIANHGWRRGYACSARLVQRRRPRMNQKAHLSIPPPLCFILSAKAFFGKLFAVIF